MNFEVGDWLLSPEDEIIELLELDLENGVHNKIKKNSSESLAFNGYLKQCRKWKPKSGEWCWCDYYGLVKIIEFKYTTHIEVQCVYGIKNLNNNPIVKLDELEPFIGELPNRAKRMKHES